MILADHLRTQKVWNKVVKLEPHLFYRVPGQLKTVEMCEDAVKDAYWDIEHVPIG